MHAIVSGRSGRALILDGESLKSFDVDDPSRVVSRHRSELPYLFGEATDLRAIENTTLESVERELQRDCDFTWALDLTLISLDAELPDDIRQEAMEGLDELLTENTTIESLENVLYSKPLPEDSDLRGALEICAGKLKDVAGFLQRLADHQLLIREVEQAWESIPTKTFGTHENRERFKHAAVKEGLYHTLVTLESPALASTFLLKAGLNRTIQQLPNHRQVLQAWTVPFRQTQEMPEVSRDEEEETFAEERFGKRARIDRKAILREAVRRKSVIVDAMHRRDLARVEALIDDLVVFQQSNSESQHTAKSLCDLAMEAKMLGMSSLQLALTERSINIAPGDDWSWAQYGDALLRMGRLDEALKAYEQADAFGAGVIAKTGRGEVLKAQGRFADAFTAFEEVIRQHPDDVVAKNGRAEVLKAQGRFADAVTAFEEVIRQHPDDVVAKNGRAGVLKAQGRFADALTAFEEVIKEYPENEIAKTGRSCVLFEMGHYQEALESLPEDAPVTVGDWINYHIRGMVLLRLGKTMEAIRLFNNGLQNSPFPSDKDYFKGALALAWLRGRRYREAGEVLDAVTSPLLLPSTNVIRIHLFGAQGISQRAIEAYENLKTSPHLLTDELTQELHHRYVLHKAPTKDDEWVFDREVKIFLRAA